MTMEQYGLYLGKSRAAIAAYRRLRDVKKGTDAKVVLDMYKAELKEQFDVKEQLQNIYYELKEVRKLKEFGVYLESKGLYKKRCVEMIFNKAFRTSDRLIGKPHIENHKKVLEFYKEWREENE